MADLQTYIFIGRSGSGKGTQANLLVTHLQGLESAATVIYLETGSLVRNFINQPTYSGQIAKKILENGDRQPDFVAIYLWSHFLLNDLKSGQHLVFDGTPRSLVEAQALDSAFAFYERSKPHVIFLDVSDECATKRLLARGRNDDDGDGIKKRLAWYERDVEPVIDYYRRHSGYQFVRIDGEQTVPTVQAEIRTRCV